MVRTSSHLASCVIAAALVSGCQVTIHSGNSPAQSPPPPPPPAKSTKSTSRPRPKPAKPDPEPQRRATPKWRLPTNNAPRIDGSIAFGNGRSGAFRGLAYVIPENSRKLPSFDALVPFAVLYTDRFEIEPQEFTSGFPGTLSQNEWFAIRYEGEFRVPSNGVYQFRLTADDGAVLYVDDRRIVVNDGLHSARSAEGEAELTKGTHRLQLDYFQADRGKVALILLLGQKGKFEPLVGVR